ncbi:hypothetical protein ISN44_As07g003000 [Arabidopsis suecica]|uniref:Uncharacterized protein n=1 Tax=Arabidopsis suecica TaxID=45249 RepID=A0A8T2BNI9_ARASU|nr:hypothetical protein ISN44_As07g003000 [Arabidopsis suecica]
MKITELLPMIISESRQWIDSMEKGCADQGNNITPFCSGFIDSDRLFGAAPKNLAALNPCKYLKKTHMLRIYETIYDGPMIEYTYMKITELLPMIIYESQKWIDSMEKGCADQGNRSIPFCAGFIDSDRLFGAAPKNLAALNRCKYLKKMLMLGICETIYDGPMIEYTCKF